MYDINDAYLEALQEANSKRLQEKVTIDDKIYDVLLDSFRSQDDVAYAFIGQQILYTIDEYSDYIKSDAVIDGHEIAEMARKIYESNALDYIKNYIDKIAVGELEEIGLLDNKDVKEYNDKADRLTPTQRMTNYIDRFQNAINKEEMYKIIDEAYNDSNLSGEDFQKMITGPFRDIIEDNFNIEMDNKNGMTVYQQIIKHQF